MLAVVWRRRRGCRQPCKRSTQARRHQGRARWTQVAGTAVQARRRRLIYLWRSHNITSTSIMNISSLQMAALNSLPPPGRRNIFGQTATCVPDSPACHPKPNPADPILTRTVFERWPKILTDYSGAHGYITDAFNWHHTPACTSWLVYCNKLHRINTSLVWEKKPQDAFTSR